MNGVIRVLLVDGDEDVREELNQMFGNEEGMMVIGEVRSGEAALAEARRLSPDVAILLAGDDMPDENIIYSARAISEAQLTSRVIIMAENPMQYLVSAIKSGVTGILPNDIDRGELLSTIRKIHRWFPS
jgi:DNA-binding NarL/FixJ family response regulator